MGIFRNKKTENDFFEELKNDVEKIDKDSIDFLFKENHSADSLTIDEIINNDYKSSENSVYDVNPIDALKAKVQNNGENADEISNEIPDTVSNIKFNFEKIINETSDVSQDDNTDTNDENASLLEKCKAYTKDDEGNDFSENKEPLYKLESVADILKSETNKALDKLSKKYDVVITDETKNTKEETSNETPVVTETEEATVNNGDSTKTQAFEKLVNDSQEYEKTNKNNFEEQLLENNPDVLLDSLDKSIPDISDIDNVQKISDNTQNDLSQTTTVRFTPVKEIDGETENIVVSSFTHTLDFTNNFEKQSDVISETIEKPVLEKTEFDDYESKNEITNTQDLKKALRKLSIIKRRKFLLCILSFISTILISALFIQPFSDKIITDSKGAMIFCLITFLINVAANFDMFKSVKNIFGNKCNGDIAGTFLSVMTSLLLISQITVNSADFVNNVFNITFIATAILTIKALVSFKDTSINLSNLKQISTKNKKNAVILIDDPSVTYAMAKDSVDGDVLLAGSRKTDFVADFMKYSEYPTVLSGKVKIFFIVTLIIALLCAVTSQIYFHSITAALYSATAVATIFSLPSLFLINILPNVSANRKLNKIGAMINGTEAANKIENANAAVLSTSDIFPAGSIVLKDVKILSNNNFDDLILRAASLTQAVGSPLAPIFKQIAKTNSSYVLPDSDTVKYEETLGLSGWVDNELLFIGNRTLLQTHGIDVPSIEYDRKILKNGFFPIYLATAQKPCAVIIVNYEPDINIAKQLRKVTDYGVTLLFKNCDPNITESMIADYFDIFEDSVKIVTNAGDYMYKKVSNDTEVCSAPATFKHNSLAFLSILNASSKIKKSNTLLSIAYIISSIIIAGAFLYTALTDRTAVPSSLMLLGIEAAATVLTYIIYLFNKA